MIEKYNHQKIEKKWWKKWSEQDIFRTDLKDKTKKNFYLLDMFSYPSGDGLHIGHTEQAAITDTFYRYKKMKGFNVLHPQGFDSFGLPAENFARKTKTHPAKRTEETIKNFKKQMNNLGLGYDFSGNVTTSNPEYYKHTQSIFGKFFENDITYKKTVKANWCESCKTVIATEQMQNGACERCKTVIEQKDIPSWMFKITDFADDLIWDEKNEKKFGKIDWPLFTKINQNTWIGKSEGAEIDFSIEEEEYIDINKGDGLDAYKDCTREVERFNVVVIIESPDSKEFLCAKWKKVDWQGFVTGGIEDGHCVRETAIKEVQEETGYQNIEIKKIYNKSSHGKFYHVGKKVNRFAHYQIVHVRLKDLEKIDRSEEEKEIADMIWVEKSKVNDFLKREDMKYPWRVVNGEDKISQKIKVFTTRADTLFGVTFMVLAPEHKLVEGLKSHIKNFKEVEKYISDTKKKTELERLEGKEKTGVKFEGIVAINPAIKKDLEENKDTKFKEGDEKIPVFISEYVLNGYGTGAIMAVPAHDKRDNEFAERFCIKIKSIVFPELWRIQHHHILFDYLKNDENFFKNKKLKITWELKEYGIIWRYLDAKHKEIDFKKDLFEVEIMSLNNFLNAPKDRYWNNISPIDRIFSENGILVNSGKFNGMKSKKAKEKITEYVDGKFVFNFHLKDWSISRQRYWGTPIPIVYSPTGEAKFVGEENLPWILPTDVNFIPTGEAPLKNSKELFKRTERIFGKGWIPEVDTMDTFVDSSWYFLRYCDPKNEENFASPEAIKNWMPVDLYIGGVEHTNMHLLFARFFTKAMKKIGMINFDEPFLKLRHQGFVCDENGKKMSKSKGNIVNPDDIVIRFGADATRTYILFSSSIEDNIIWNEDNIVGVYRFLEKVWRQQEKKSDEENMDVRKELHKCIKSVGEKIENLKFNTAVSDMMKFINFCDKYEKINKKDFEDFIKILSPFAPHISDEMFGDILLKKEWPKFDEKLTEEKFVKIGIQINGKRRAEIKVSVGEKKEDIEKKVLELEEIKRWLGKNEIKKFIYVEGKIISLII